MKVSINMAMSIDGKIATKARGPAHFGSKHDHRRMEEIRSVQDVVINGAGTFLVHPVPLKIRAPDLVAKRRAQGLPEQPISAVVSSRLDIPKNTAWEKAVDIERWIFCGKEAPLGRIKSLREAGIHVVCGKGLRPTPKEILAAFAKAGAKNILLEGGGDFNASFLQKDLVQRLYLTIVPLLIGGVESPTFFEGQGLAKFTNFSLTELVKHDSELHLTYERAS